MPAADDIPMCDVRRRDVGDLDDCVSVLAEVHKVDGYPVNWPATPADWLAPPEQLAAWVAELDGRIVGHLALSPPVEGDAAPALWGERTGAAPGEVAVVTRLFVSPDARGHGIGALLMSQALREAGTRGLHPVLDVLAADTGSVAFYEHLGWTLLDIAEQRWSQEQTVTVHCYAAPVRSTGQASRHP
ncbi:GNAT family N-acetyltransferase [Streptomyces sp. NPDC101062]|uniref:GNAT family N-acetyltransferase n=1 Tax=unclassified Streptomyces TaxID=2593676 RepID=UPI0038300912